MSYVFFFNDTATTEIYTLSLHDALPIYSPVGPVTARPPRCYTVLGATVARISEGSCRTRPRRSTRCRRRGAAAPSPRSEEHTSELQSRQYLVCRLLLEKKKTSQSRYHIP